MIRQRIQWILLEFPLKKGFFLLEQEFEKMHSLEARHWWFRAKRSLALAFVKKIFNGNKKAIIVDIGCGTGGTLEALKKAGFASCKGFDLNKTAVSYCREKGLDVSVKSLMSVREKNSFDCILLLDVLEHIENDSAALKAVWESLKKFGIAIINVPAFQFLYGKHDSVFGHKRRYNSKRLLELLEKQGFAVEKRTYWNFFLFFPTALFKIFGLRDVSADSKGSDIFPVPEPANSFFYALVSAERALFLNGISMPFGTSFFCIARK